MSQPRPVRSFAAALLEETEIDVELDTTGTLYLALTEHDQRDASNDTTGKIAPVSGRTADANEARELEPCISVQLLGALLFPQDIQVENRRLLSALANSVSNSA